MTPGHKLKALDAMNNSGLWITWTTLGHELRALDVMNKVVVDMKDFGSKAKCFKSNEQLRVVDDMNDFGSYELTP